MTASKYDSECFFITPIGEDDSPERKRANGVMKAMVEPAAAAHNLTVVRADEMAKPGMITAQIVEHIVGAKAVVADLTGENANVFYELAVRDAAQLPSVMIAETGTDLPFDKAQDRTIFFDSTDLASAWEAKEQLTDFLGAALGGGVSNPIASAMVWKEYAESGKPVEEAVAQLAEQLALVAADVQRLSKSQLYSAGFPGPGVKITNLGESGATEIFDYPKDQPIFQVGGGEGFKFIRNVGKVGDGQSSGAVFGIREEPREEEGT